MELIRTSFNDLEFQQSRKILDSAITGDSTSMVTWECGNEREIEHAMKFELFSRIAMGNLLESEPHSGTMFALQSLQCKVCNANSALRTAMFA
jgi:hypothetical protein